MTVHIPRAIYDSFSPGTFETRVAAFRQALAAFAHTVNEPAPVEAPWVEVTARGGGFFTITDDQGVPEPVPTLEERRAARAAEVDIMAALALSAGAPYVSRDETVQGRIDVDPDSQTKIGAMATFAGFVKDGVVSWGPPYNGWILADNTIAPLAGWQDGLGLALQAGSFTGSVILHARAIKNAVMASDDPENEAIDQGWPS